MNALILVDIQNDFLPTGALPVPHGNEVVEIANSLQPRFDLVVATQDWHPADHGSFAANHDKETVGDTIDLNGLEQVLWPVHCVQHTRGAEFAPALDTSRVKKIFVKGTDPAVDSYSGFFDNARRRATGLDGYLKQQHVTDAYIMGLATDYCVKFTALDAQDLGFKTYVVQDGCRGVNLHPDDVSNSLAEMRRAGINIVTSEVLLQS